ncbi:hypothetical protein [Lactobacillus sp. wkB10]|uniref:hypothetical protein n=1 Tax=Lactobacillus sp. wkB10 TaxID=1545701 RepID=UPI000512D8D0|nr:hypothetical protein [Lactobacillus sp. wkB10]KGG53971.1 hypothetical protein LACWKB10_1191 [Lactobacillus sp. wkB10]
MATTKKSETKKTNSELALEAHAKQNSAKKKAESSTIANMMGKTQDFVICEGTSKEYTITLQYPGAARALEIEDIAGTGKSVGDIAYSTLMEEAIKDVIVMPKVQTIDSYWNSHAGLAEVAITVLSFLNAGIEGNL